MTARRGGLGRGLGALIPSSSHPHGHDEPADTGPLPGPVAVYREIPLDAISPNPRQPREHFDEEALSELVSSIREVGLLQPVVVRAVGAGRYELIMGERRLRAARTAGLSAIPAIVRDTPDDDLLRDALLENLHRQQLNPLEEAAAYAQLLADFGATHDELASRIGRSRSHITNTIRLMNLPPPVQRRVAAGVLSAGHARALLALPDATAQDALAHRVVAEGLSVRAVEEIVALADQGPAAVRRQRRSVREAPGATELADRLSDVLETRVSVQLGRRRGKVIIEFASVDDLERIVAVIAPDVAPA
ncbi:MAG: ParB family transcriptional regulator, chromosome partitioning protein [Frankiaceae bacterium]|nr:ParB family transcriptional regulator, chromosome partitioning protein [Frankiaceae bacterium]